MKEYLSKLLLLAVVLSLVAIYPILAAANSDFRKRAYQIGEEEYQDVDIEAEIGFGRELAAIILGYYPLLDDDAVQTYVSTVGKGVALQVGRPELDYHFGVLDSEDLNAYACPGGYIFITKGALQVMTNEAQLVGVLTHEMTHVDQRHIVKELKIRAKDVSATSGLADMMSSSTATARAALDMLADRAFNVLFKEGFSKRDEFQSDEGGVMLTASLGYDWQSYRDFIGSLKHLMNDGYGETLSKTHPGIEERIGNMNTVAETNGIADMIGKTNQDRFEERVQLTAGTVQSDFSDFTVSKEIELGRLTAAKLLGSYHLLNDSDVQEYVSLLGTGLSAQFGREELKYYFAVLDTEKIGTFACPGGYILITKGALEKMEDEAQLIGQLAYAIGQINQNQLVEMIKLDQSHKLDTNVKLPLENLSGVAVQLFQDGDVPENIDVLALDSLVVDVMVAMDFSLSSYRKYLIELDTLSGDEDSLVGQLVEPSLRVTNIQNVLDERGLTDYVGKTNKDRFDDQKPF